MNERIQALAEQAKQYAREQMAHPMDPNLFSAAVFQEKFAELIIQECLDCANWVGESNKNPVEPVHTAHAINKRIKQRFGVEE